MKHEMSRAQREDWDFSRLACGVRAWWRVGPPKMNSIFGAVETVTRELLTKRHMHARHYSARESEVSELVSLAVSLRDTRESHAVRSRGAEWWRIP
jgi:hypothetical protein